ncbi:MAG: hypothetical protein ACRDSF_00435 [Pseudonocardiaceae bacterium]
MSEIERYQHGAVAPMQPIAGTAMVGHDPAANPLDGWIQVMADVAKLAEYIADTELVPDAVRRRPAAVAAIILTGREMNLPPMMALRHIHIVKGKPGMSAEIMRAQVLAAGHELDYVEMSDTRCVAKGRRRGESEWLTVSFTAAQARTAKIDLGGYPEDKLVARATSRLCRRKFADCIAGIPSVDEIEDDEAPQVESGQERPPQVGRTAQRRTKPRTAPARPATEQRVPAPTQEPPSGPPLPGEDGYDDAPADSQQSADPTTELATAAQTKRLGAIFGDAGIKERDDRLRITSGVLNREIGSWKEITKQDAGVLIDTLEELGRDGDLAETLLGLLGHQSTDDQQSTDAEGRQP